MMDASFRSSFPPFEVTAPMPAGTATPTAAWVPNLIAEDRSMAVRPDQLVRTGWVDIDQCVLGCRDRMSPEAVEKKFRVLLNLGENAPWPPIVGHWNSDRFIVDDGRHSFLASLMLGREQLFVAWLEARP